MKTLAKTLMLLMLAASMLSAQKYGDYRSAASGNWNAAATWSIYNGSSWQASTTMPDSTFGGMVLIQNGHTVTLNADLVLKADSVKVLQGGTFVVAEGKKLEIRDTSSLRTDTLATVTVNGTIVNKGTIGTKPGVFTFGGNGVYVHAQNGGSLPVSVWSTGSTCMLTGITANAPSNGNQNFHNFIFNCPGYTTAVNMGWANNTINGDVRVLSSGNKIYFRFTNNTAAAPSVNVITIKGNVIVDDTLAALTSTGSSGNDTINVVVEGNITSKGIFNLANGSGASCTWKVKGNLSFPYGQVTTNSGTSYPDSLLFIGNARQTMTKGPSVGSFANIRFVVRNGATLVLDTLAIGGTISTFALDSGAAITTGHTRGFKGNLNMGGAVTLSPGGSYVYEGSVAQSDSSLPANVRNLLVNNAQGVTLKAPVTVNNELTLANGMVSAGANIITIAGTVARTNGYVGSPMRKTLAASGWTVFEVGTSNGFSPVGVSLTGGAGAMTVTAVQGMHPNIFDAAKAIDRYWTLAADAGITKADLNFEYLPSDIHGAEGSYGAWRYNGTGTAWTAIAGSVDLAKHSVRALNVTAFSDWTAGESPLSAVETPEDGGIPTEFFLNQNYPNPFNPSTLITYGLPRETEVTVKVYNLIGKEVATLFAGRQTAGVHSLRFDAGRLSSGVYLCRVQAGSSVDVKRMLLMK